MRPDGLVSSLTAVSGATRRILGHASIQTTADIYVDWELDQVAEIQRAMIQEEE